MGRTKTNAIVLDGIRRGAVWKPCRLHKNGLAPLVYERGRWKPCTPHRMLKDVVFVGARVTARKNAKNVFEPPVEGVVKSILPKRKHYDLSIVVNFCDDDQTDAVIPPECIAAILTHPVPESISVPLQAIKPNCNNSKTIREQKYLSKGRNALRKKQDVATKNHSAVDASHESQNKSNHNSNSPSDQDKHIHNSAEESDTTSTECPGNGVAKRRRVVKACSSTTLQHTNENGEVLHKNYNKLDRLSAASSSNNDERLPLNVLQEDQLEQRDARKVPLRIVLAVCFAFRNATPQGTSIRQYVERVSNKLYHTRSLAQVKKELEKAQMQLVFLHNKQQINSCSQESSIASGPCKTTPGEESPSSNRIMSIKQAIYKSPFQSTPESILISVRMYLVEATKDHHALQPQDATTVVAYINSLFNGIATIVQRERAEDFWMQSGTVSTTLQSLKAFIQMFQAKKSCTHIVQPSHPMIIGALEDLTRAVQQAGIPHAGLQLSATDPTAFYNTLVFVATIDSTWSATITSVLLSQVEAHVKMLHKRLQPGYTSITREHRALAHTLICLQCIFRKNTASTKISIRQRITALTTIVPSSSPILLAALLNLVPFRQPDVK